MFLKDGFSSCSFCNESEDVLTKFQSNDRDDLRRFYQIDRTINNNNCVIKNNINNNM